MNNNSNKNIYRKKYNIINNKNKHKDLSKT